MSGQAQNPWVTEGTQSAPAQATHRVPARPQPRSVKAPTVGGLPVASQVNRAALWCVGVHGGAGESSLAALIPGAAEAHHAWPQLMNGERAPVVLVARSNLAGLNAASRACQQWAAAETPPVDVLGIVVMADSKGKLPKETREFIARLKGLVRKVWLAPWVEQWRLLYEPASDVPRELAPIVRELTSTEITTTH